MAKQKKTLILHIGTHKTGTTSIQNTLQTNSEILKKSGLYYPKDHPNNHSVSFYPLFMHTPENYFFLKKYFNIYDKGLIYRKLSELKDYWISQFEMFLKSDLKTFIISGEDFEFLPEKGDLKKLYDFINPYFNEIKIVVYFRQAQDYILSSIQENMKFGKSSLDDMETWLSERLNYKALLNAYIETFKKNSIIARAFDQDSMVNGDVVDDFLDAIGYKDIVIPKAKKANRNESLGLYSALIISERNKRNTIKNGQPGFLDHQAINLTLVDTMKKIDEPKLKIDIDIPEKQIKRINEQYAVINEFLTSDNTFKSLVNKKRAAMPSLNDIPKTYFIDLVSKCASDRIDERKAVLIRLFSERRKNLIIKLRDRILGAIIKKHDLFDSAYYLNEYKDVKNNPLKHFILTGVYEGRNPSKDFDIKAYLVKNPSVIYHAVNPIFHYKKKRK